jgi:hypothetical protein
MKTTIASALFAGGLALLAAPATATPFSFSTGNPDGLVGTASRPENSALQKFEIESADDFLLGSRTSITSASFTGLLTGSDPLAGLNNLRVEIYRVFPLDSDVNRTSGPPTFSTSQVPTRVNSPSDVALDTREQSQLSLATTALGSFSVANSVQPGGIHPLPNQTTNGNGPLTGTEVRFDVSFLTPFDLAAGHYFFVPQVGLDSGDEFFWLSAPKPIVAPGTPFLPDLQSWTRDAFLDPDWLRIGTDIVAAGPFNAAFALAGATVPEPATLWLLGLGALGLLGRKRPLSS